MKKGFTLIELLVVIAIIAILAGIVIIAVNPARQVAQARNAQRRADTLTTLNAIHQYYVDNGKFPTDTTGTLKIDSTLKQIGTGSGTGCVITCGAVSTVGCVDLTPDLVGSSGQLYLSAMPFDPVTPAAGTSQQFSGYAVTQDAANKRITVKACQTEIPPAAALIEVTR